MTHGTQSKCTSAHLLISSMSATREDFFEHVPVALMLKIAQGLPLVSIWILTQCSLKWHTVCCGPSNWSSRLPNCFISWESKAIVRRWYGLSTIDEIAVQPKINELKLLVLGTAEASKPRFMTQMFVFSWAARVISKAVRLWLMSEKSKMCERCEYRKTLSPWVYSSACNRRVPMRLVNKYNMTQYAGIGIPGTGFKCTIHLCACDTSNVYAMDDCKCGEVCAKCNYGCTCLLRLRYS